MDRFSKEARRVAERILKMPCPFCRKTMMELHYDSRQMTTVIRCGACMREFGDRTCFNPPVGCDELAFFERAEAILRRLEGIWKEFNDIEYRRIDNHRSKAIEAQEMLQTGGAGSLDDLYGTDDPVSKDRWEVRWMFDLWDATCSVVGAAQESYKEVADEYIRERIRETAEEHGLQPFEPTDEEIKLCRLGLRRPHPWDTDGFKAEDMRDFEEVLAEVVDRHMYM